jgi:hypothetical protein
MSPAIWTLLQSGRTPTIVKKFHTVPPEETVRLVMASPPLALTCALTSSER